MYRNQEKQIRESIQQRWDESSIPTTHDFITNPNHTIAGCVTGKLTCSGDMKVPQLAEELERLEKWLSHTTELVAILEAKLEPVMLAIPKSGTEDCPRPYLVPAADAVYTLGVRVNIQNEKLQSIINRLEV